MQFIKKVVVLKQIEQGFSAKDKCASGIARIELFDGTADFYLSTVNFIPVSGGSYSAIIIDTDGKLFHFDLGLRPSSFKTTFVTPPNLSRGFSVGICLIKNDLPVTVAFARDSEFFGTVTHFKKAVAEHLLSLRKERQKDTPAKPCAPLNTKQNDDGKKPTDDQSPSKELPSENFPDPSPIKPPYPPAPNPDPEKNPPDEFLLAGVDRLYDDEAVATENYYSFEKELNTKLDAIKEWDNGRIRLENELSDCDCKEKTQESQADGCSIKDETGSIGGKGGKQRPYFSTIKKDLDKIFSSYPEENALQSVITDSKFVKINYSENKHYVVGTVKQNGREKYICYGVPAAYSETPPIQLAGYCSFIPLSVFNLKGQGYWMMFQDAVTGKCVFPK